MGRDICGGVRPGIERLLERVSRYDLVLTVIPLAFVTALLATDLLAVSVRESMAVASTVGALAVADALFVNPPRPNGGAGE